jgi:hypothetical protein
MFLQIVTILILISILLAIRSVSKIDEKPGTEEVKKSLDKSKIVFWGNHSSSKG